jgi:4-hydroxy-tetrahydrodipicolinate reductase
VRRIGNVTRAGHLGCVVSGRRVLGVTSVGVIGASGRMGTLACAAVEAADGLELAARVSRGDALDLLDGCVVAVDCTVPDAVLGNIESCVARGIHVVVGTSGFDDRRLRAVEQMLADHPAVGVLVVPNFSIGAVLMMRFAAEAAQFLDSAEIVEMHHDGKVDAPSGTALRTAALIAQSRRSHGRAVPPDPTRSDPLGARGGRSDGVPVHSLRVTGAVAHQEVVLGSLGETLTIRHDMLDRAAAMPGLLASIRAVPTIPGLTVGLERVLGLD